MSNSPRWLQDYYGPDFDVLNPVVVQQGNKMAIVKLQKTSRAVGSFSNIGYVLVKMIGRHAVTPHMSLHEGVATEADLKKMQQTLTQEDE